MYPFPSTHTHTLSHTHTLTHAHIHTHIHLTHTHTPYREVAVRVGQALVDSKRLNIVSADPYFRDDPNLFLELGEAARLLPDNSDSRLLTDAPKWFQRLKDDEEEDIDNK